MENLERLESPEGCQDRASFESDVGNSVTGRCYWRNDIGTHHAVSLCCKIKENDILILKALV